MSLLETLVLVLCGNYGYLVWLWAIKAPYKSSTIILGLLQNIVSMLDTFSGVCKCLCVYVNAYIYEKVYVYVFLSKVCACVCMCAPYRYVNVYVYV